MHGRELGERVISLNKAQPKMCVDDSGFGEEENRIFVGGLSWDTTDRQLEDAFSYYGRIMEDQIMVDRETGHPRGFGFVTFADQCGTKYAIREMHGRELGEHVISVVKAQSKMGGYDSGYREEDNRIFVEGLLWDTTDRQLEDAFNRYGRILESHVISFLKKA